jgi:hypothetical protein
MVNGCKQNDLPFPGGNFESIHTYNDTAASAENPNIKISSGKERLYMAYGRGTALSAIINGLYLSGISNIQGVVMATDLNGNVIWSNTLPVGLALATPIELADGSCLVVGADVGAVNNNLADNIIHLFRFDADGKQTLNDSVTMPANFGAMSFLMSLDAMALSGSETLIYGSAVDFDTYLSQGFALYYTPATGTKTFKTIPFLDPANFNNLMIYNCTKSKDGGLIYIGVSAGLDVPGIIDFGKTTIIKTDINSDTIWTKFYDYLTVVPPSNFVLPTNIIESRNGDIYLCNNDIPNLDFFTTFKGFIFHLNAQGDSLGSYSIMGPGNSYCAAIIEGDDESIYAIFNEYPGFLYLEFKPVFTQYQSVLHKLDKNLKLIQKSNFQNQRSDLITSVCKTPDSNLAFFGLFRSVNYRTYLPGMIVLN